MAISNKKLYTRHTKETCIKAIEKAIATLSNIRIDETDKESSKFFLCRKGSIFWGPNDTEISIATNVLSGLTEIKIVIQYELQETGTGGDVAFNLITEGASFTDQKLNNNRKHVEQIEKSLSTISHAISAQLGKCPVEYTTISNVWNYGDSLYQKLKQLDELKQKEVITIDEFVMLQKDLIHQVQKE